MAFDSFDTGDKIQIGFAIIVQIMLMLVTPTKPITNIAFGLAFLSILYYLFHKVLIRLYMSGSVRTSNQELASSEAHKHLRWSLAMSLIVSVVLGLGFGIFESGTPIETVKNYLHSISFTTFIIGFIVSVVADAKDAVEGKGIK